MSKSVANRIKLPHIESYAFLYVETYTILVVQYVK